MMQNINTAYRSDVKVKSKFKKDIETILLAKKAEQKIVKDEIAELRLSERLVYIKDPSYEDKTRDNQISDTGTSMKRQVIQTHVPLLPQCMIFSNLTRELKNTIIQLLLAKGMNICCKIFMKLTEKKLKLKVNSRKMLKKLVSQEKPSRKFQKMKLPN